MPSWFRQTWSLLLVVPVCLSCSLRNCGAFAQQGWTRPPHVARPITLPHGALPAPAAGGLAAQVVDVRSDSVGLTWSATPGATAVKIVLGSEPGATPTSPPLDATELVSLPPNVHSTVVRGLAPNVHTFLYVEAQTPAGPVGRTVHALTLGGPRADLDTPVRQLALYTTNVLEIVLANGDGAELERGSWQVDRHDGRAVTVSSKNRRSIPVGEPGYEIGFGRDTPLEPVDVDHHVYLRLGEPIGSHDVLHIRGPRGIDMHVAVSDRYLETPAIQLNQVGYNPRATRRYAYVSGWLGDGGAIPLREIPSRAEILREPADPLTPRTDVVATLPVTERSRADADAGVAVEQIDLASVPAAENVTYRIRLPGVGVSYRTEVSERAAFRAFYVATRGLYHNRWGGDLRPDCTDWPRPIDHRTVFTSDVDNPWDQLPESTPHTGERALRGGYHDAGDFDQRPSHTTIAELVMRAYELHPASFTDGQLTLPESGNRIPDLLDEALWGVAAWEQLQEADGGVRGGVESWRHPLGIYFASDDQLPYWTFARDANTTARAAGLFAQASRLVAPFDAAHAARLRERAIRAYRYAAAHHAETMFLLYPASELTRLGAGDEWPRTFERLYGSLGAEPNYTSSQLELSEYRREPRIMPDWVLGYVTSPAARPEIRDAVIEGFDHGADEASDDVLNSPIAHRNARPPEYPTGYGQGTVQGRYLDTIYARLQLGSLPPDRAQRYFDAMSVAADYVLGANPDGMVYITGLGVRHPEEPLHLDSLVWVKQGRPPVPGIPVYGPVNELPPEPWYRPGAATFYPPFMRFPHLLRYGDIRSFVNMNEFSTWEAMAPHAEHFGALVGSGQMPPTEWLPAARRAQTRHH